MYKAWGENRYTYLTTPTTLRFTGQRQESGLGGAEGLYYYGARWYDPTLGRFAQADSIVPGAFNPQSLNRYSYTLNNPLRYIDPSGHDSVCGSAYSDPECNGNDPSNGTGINGDSLLDDGLIPDSGGVTGGSSGAGSSGTAQPSGGITLPSNGYTLGPSDYWTIAAGSIRTVASSGVRPIVPVLINGRIVYYVPPPLIRELNRLLPDGFINGGSLILTIAPNQIENVLTGAPGNEYVGDALIDIGGFGAAGAGGTSGFAAGTAAVTLFGAHPLVLPIAVVLGSVSFSMSYYNVVASTNLRTDMSEWVAQPLGPASAVTGPVTILPPTIQQAVPVPTPAVVRP
jgi:RHS repeat-associated protein